MHKDYYLFDKLDQVTYSNWTVINSSLWELEHMDQEKRAPHHQNLKTGSQNVCSHHPI